MNTDIFANMLFGDDPIESYVKSVEIQNQIKVNATLQTIVDILFENCMTTGEKFEKKLEHYHKNLEKEIAEKLKKELEE